VGYYGFHGDEELTENSPPGNGFLARMAVEWEAEALKPEKRVPGCDYAIWYCAR
jgi:NAD dependent epimerase/dehydratase family enzyme